MAIYRGCEEEDRIAGEELRLARAGRNGQPAGASRAALKVTHRVWVHEWTGPVGGARARVTARIADRRVEDMAVEGAVLDRRDAERRVLEALGRR